MSVHSPLAIVTHTEETGHPKLLAEVAFHAIGRGDWSAARNAANSCLGQASVAQDLELMALSAAVRGIVKSSARRGWYLAELSREEAAAAFHARNVIETGHRPAASFTPSPGGQDEA